MFRWTLLLLTLLPWTRFFRRPRQVPRVLFAPFFLVSDRRARRKRRLHEIALASLRSLAIAILVLLWALPKSPSVKTSDVAAPRQALKSVLIVDGSDSGPALYPTPIASPGVAEYLDLALDESPIDVETIVSADFASTSLTTLRRYDAIVLADLSAPTDSELDKLTQYVAKDRFVLVWPGPRTSPERWTDVWKKLGFDARTSRRELNKSPNLFASASPFERIFPDADAARLDALPVERAAVTTGSDVGSLLVDSGTGTPTFSRLDSRWYWFAPSPDPNDGALALAPYFVTLVEKVLEYPRHDAVGADKVKTAEFNWRGVLWMTLALVVLAELAMEAPTKLVPTRQTASTL